MNDFFFLHKRNEAGEDIRCQHCGTCFDVIWQGRAVFGIHEVSCPECKGNIKFVASCSFARIE